MQRADPLANLEILDRLLPPPSAVHAGHDPWQVLQVMDRALDRRQRKRRLSALTMADFVGEQVPLLDQQTLYKIANNIFDSRTQALLGEDPTKTNRYEALRRRNPGGLISVGNLDYTPPDSDGVLSCNSLLVRQFNLKVRPGTEVAATQLHYIERLTRYTLRRNNFYFDQAVKDPLTGEIIQRPPCRQGRRVNGNAGCAVHYINGSRGHIITGQLGGYLSAEEADVFFATARLPPDMELRKCALCLIQDYSKHVGMYNVNGTGRVGPSTLSHQLFQIPINTPEGYDIRACYQDNPVLMAPMMGFKPAALRITSVPGPDADLQFVDDSQLWYYPPTEAPAFP